MSLEAALAANTEAMVGLTTALNESNAGRAAAVTAITGGETAAATPPRKPRGAPAKTDAPKTEPAAAGPKVLSSDDVRTAAGTFLQAVDDKDERAKRKEFVKAVVAHFGASLVTEIKEADRAQAVAWFEAKGRGEDVSFGGDEDEQQVEDEDDLLG